MIANLPFSILGNAEEWDVEVTARGGGIAGQMGAVRLGVSRALVENDPAVKSPLKKEGLMTRDARAVERKKFGRKKARKRFQFSKR
jgi:small subunit ribosomal protein S9